MLNKSVKVLLFLMPIVFAITSCRNSSIVDKNNIVGSYESISESEWELTVMLDSNMTGLVVLENWDPRKYDQRDIVKHDIHWDVDKKGILTLKYKDHNENVRYVPLLSMEDVGKDEARPGLMGIDNDKSIIGNTKLWRRNPTK